MMLQIKQIQLGVVLAAGIGVLGVRTASAADPATTHHTQGSADIAGADEGDSRAIRVLGISPSGAPIGDACLSFGRSTANSAPRLGIDALGQPFAAFAGMDDVAGTGNLYA